MSQSPVQVHYVLDNLLPISVQPTLIVQNAPALSPMSLPQPLQPAGSRPSSPVPSLLPSPSPTAVHSRSPSAQGYIPTRPPSHQDQTTVQEDQEYDWYLSEEHCPLNRHITYGTHLTVTHDETLPGRLHPARYTQLIFMADPFVLAYRQGSNQQYGKSVHAAPNYNHPSPEPYTDDDLIFLDQDSSYRESVDAALLGMKDLLVTAEIHRYRCLQAGYAAKEEELRKKVDELKRIGITRRHCVLRLERANAIKRIEDERDSYCPGEEEGQRIATIRETVDIYPIGSIYHSVYLYLNKHVANPYLHLYIINHPSWTDLKILDHPPIGVPQGEDLHGYRGDGDELFQHPSHFPQSPANRNYYRPLRITASNEA
ncbi:hypothetical protein EDB89DRAFT_2080070 [Lactarius sanguifluus]|nr:hypothetical protein EDB89DRAFT_2080070 [Lactarius sanguifluus]